MNAFRLEIAAQLTSRIGNEMAYISFSHGIADSTVLGIWTSVVVVAVTARTDGTSCTIPGPAGAIRFYRVGMLWE